MAEMKAEGHAKKRTIRLPPSVPFLWEVRPGIAKKDWKPEASATSRVLPPPTPIKFIASIPFNWEEKPGTPLPSFLQPAEEPMVVQQSATLMTLPPPPVYSLAYFNGCNSNDDQGDDIETFGFETDDSFSSASSILENSSLAVSTVVSTIAPEQKTYKIDNDSDHQEIPSSPASETGSTSSYATGASSLVGASFLECLFPLLPPNAGFLEKGRYPDEESQTARNNFDRESNNTVVISKPPTLGELILMSRTRSYQRKAAQISEKHISMVILAITYCLKL